MRGVTLGCTLPVTRRMTASVLMSQYLNLHTCICKKQYASDFNNLSKYQISIVGCPWKYFEFCRVASEKKSIFFVELAHEISENLPFTIQLIAHPKIFTHSKLSMKNVISDLIPPHPNPTMPIWMSGTWERLLWFLCPPGPWGKGNICICCGFPSPECKSVSIRVHLTVPNFVYAIRPTAFRWWLSNSQIWWPWTRPWID